MKPNQAAIRHRKIMFAKRIGEAIEATKVTPYEAKEAFIAAIIAIDAQILEEMD